MFSTTLIHYNKLDRGQLRRVAAPLEKWRGTYETLHRWLQIVGKTRLARAPMQNHWWQVPL